MEHHRFLDLIRSHIKDVLTYTEESVGTTADISGPNLPAFGKKKSIVKKKMKKPVNKIRVNESSEQVKSFYHKFTGSDIVVFCESTKSFLEWMGMSKNTAEYIKLFNYVNENFSYFIPIKIGEVNFLVFSESEIRLLEGKVNDSLIDTTLALWCGYKKYPNNQEKMYETAIDLLKNYFVVESYKKLVEFYNKKFSKSMEIVEFDTASDIDSLDLKTASDIVFENYFLETIRKTINQKTNVIVDKLQTGKTFHRSIGDIETVLFKEDKRFTEASNILQKFGIPANAAEEITEQAVKIGEFHYFLKYIKNRKIELSNLRESKEFYETVKRHTEFSEFFIEWLVGYKWPGSPSVGKGEVALAILLKNGVKPPRGDVAIDGVLYEVKGTGGTLRGQRGYGSGLDAARIFNEGYYDPGYGPDPLEWNIRRRGGIVECHQNILAESVVRTDMISLWESAIKAIYLNMDTSWVKKCLPKDGKINEAFIEKWFIEALKYYHTTENFEALIVIDGKKVAAVYPFEFEKATDILTIKRVPSFTSQAGTQSISFGVGVK